MKRYLKHGISLSVLLLSACSLINAPDRDRVLPSDGGVEMDADADAPIDTGVDADSMIPDGGDACPDGGCPMPEICDDGMDNDLDGLIDCNDFDCLAAADCCGMGSRALGLDWSDTSSLVRSYPPGSLVPTVGRDTAGERLYLDNFGDGGTSGLITLSCQPMTLGVRIEFSMQPTSSCGGAECYTAVVLTGANTALDGEPIIDDLAIRMNDSGQIAISQGWPRTLMPWTSFDIAPGNEVYFEVDITPGEYPDGEPALTATITASLPAGPSRLLDGFPFIALRDLDRSGSACGAVPGLYIAAEGRGDAVRLYPLETQSLECVNPSHFRASPGGDTTLRHRDRLDIGPWAAGGLGSPALLSSCGTPRCWEEGGSVRWDLMVEGSNILLESELFTHVGYAVDHGATTAWEERETWFPTEEGRPRWGENPPSCIDDGTGATCDGNRSLRDPSVWAPRDPTTGRLTGTMSDESIYLAYAREQVGDDPTSVQRDSFAIHIDGLTPNPTEILELEPAKLTPDTDGIRSEFGCVSLRHPSLSGATRDGAGVGPGFTFAWLLFTCERDDGPTSILIAELDQTFSYRRGTVREVLHPRDLGPYAAGGVWGAEMVVDWSLGDTLTPRPRVRIWFMGRSRDRQVSVNLAQGEGTVVLFPAPDGPGTPALYEFPDMVAFGGNPVLRPTDAVLHEDSTGTESLSRLLGLSVTPRADNAPRDGTPQTLRFLLARRVYTGGVWSSELIPLEQNWRSP